MATILYSPKEWFLKVSQKCDRKPYCPVSKVTDCVFEFAVKKVTWSPLTLSHIETSSLICRANQWTGFYMIGTSFMKELKNLEHATIQVSNLVRSWNVLILQKNNKRKIKTDYSVISYLLVFPIAVYYFWI